MRMVKTSPSYLFSRTANDSVLETKMIPQKLLLVIPQEWMGTKTI